MANEATLQRQVKADNSGGNAIIGALLGGGLGALGGGLYADVDEEATPSEKLKQRLQTAALVGLLGAAGGAGSGFLFGKATAPSESELAAQEAGLKNGDNGQEDWGDIGNKMGVLLGGGAVAGGLWRGSSAKYPGTTWWQRAGGGAARGGILGAVAAGLVSMAQDRNLM